MKEKKNHPLNLRERIIIEIKYRNKDSLRSISKELNRNVSTISREINGKPRKGIGKYLAEVSHRKALKRIKKRGNISKIDKYPRLKKYLIAKLRLGWSPEQISGKLNIDYLYSHPKSNI